MDDTQLLEYAARAIGRSIQGWSVQHGVAVAVLDDGTFLQPLHENHITDCMGDALRLAVKLRLNIEHHNDMSQPHPWLRIEDRDSRWTHAGPSPELNSDPLAVTRRAIVRAAAEIGKQMKAPA